MNLIFMRHGEALDNVREILSSQEIRCSTLTEKGKKQVNDSVKLLPKIDKIYVSPLIRTLQTAKEVADDQNLNIEIDNRIREINWGKFNGKENSEELDKIREKQVAGDFFVRFGQYGDNKYGIESRLCDFLTEVRKNNFKNNTILIVSHGTIISFMKRILGLKSSHAKKGKFEVFESVNFSNLDNYVKKIKNIAKKTTEERIDLFNLPLRNELLLKYREIAEDFNNIEFNEEVLRNISNGLKDNIISIDTDFENIDTLKSNLIIICIFRDFSTFAKKWFEHYMKIGVKNFVLIDNNSTDDSLEIINKIAYRHKVNIDLYKISETYNCFRSCGWRQQIMEKYGVNKWYLNVDSDELFVFEGDNINKFAKNLISKKKNAVKSMLIDVYSKDPIFEGKNIKDFKFVDIKGYKKERNLYYKTRVFGGPRNRIFGIKPSLQKIPLLYYTGSEVFVNDHFMYPWSINLINITTVNFHYKLLLNSLKLYKDLAESGIHWNDLGEHKQCINFHNENRRVSFYNSEFSSSLDEIDFKDLIS